MSQTLPVLPACKPRARSVFCDLLADVLQGLMLPCMLAGLEASQPEAAGLASRKRQKGAAGHSATELHEPETAQVWAWSEAICSAAFCPLQTGAALQHSSVSLWKS